MSDNRIRSLVDRDMDAIVEMDICGTVDPWSREEIMKFKRLRRNLCIVYDNGAGPIAYALYTMSRRELTIARLVVDDVHRRRGIGTAMLEWLKAKLQTQGRRKLVVQVDERMLPVQQFLRDCDFLCVQTYRDLYEKGVDGYEFQYDLAKMADAV